MMTTTMTTSTDAHSCILTTHRVLLSTVIVALHAPPVLCALCAIRMGFTSAWVRPEGSDAPNGWFRVFRTVLLGSGRMSLSSVPAMSRPCRMRQLRGTLSHVRRVIHRYALYLCVDMCSSVVRVRTVSCCGFKRCSHALSELLGPPLAHGLWNATPKCCLRSSCT